MRTYRSLLLTMTAAAAMTLAGAVHAAPPAGKQDVLTDKARDLYVEGELLYKKGDYARARAAYLAAWALRKHYQIAHALGDCELKLGLYRDAAEHLAYSMREAASEGASPEGEKKLYEQATAKVGTLPIRVSEAGAEVLVDGVAVGTAPLADPVFVEAGKHTLDARLGAKSASAEVEVGMGATRAVELSLAAPRVEETKGSAAAAPPSAPAAQPPPAAQVEDGGPNKALLIAGGATAGAALIAGVVLTVVANGKASDADDGAAALAQSGTSCAPESADAGCVAVRDALAGKDAFSNAAAWSFIGAGVIAAGTVIYAVTAPRATTRSASVKITPLVGEHGGGIAIAGAF